MFDGNQKRRTFLKTSGVAGAIALAGCIGGDDDSGNGNGNGNENGNANGNGDGNGDSENGNGDSTGNGTSASSVELTWLHDRNQAEDTLEETGSKRVKRPRACPTTCRSVQAYRPPAPACP